MDQAILADTVVSARQHAALRLRALLVFGTLAAGCSQSTPEQQAITAAVEALGGADRIQSIRTIVLEGEGTNGTMGGSVTPETPPNVFRIEGYRRTFDLPNARMRLEQVRTAQYPVAFATVTRMDQRLDGDLGFNSDVAVNPFAARDGAAPQPQRIADAAAQRRRREFFEHPITAVRAALSAGVTAGSRREENGLTHVDIRTAKGDLITLAIDSATNLPNHVSHLEYDPFWGDVEVETTFTGYEDVDGVRLPTRLVTKTAGFTTADVTLTHTLIDGDVGDLAAPASVRVMAAPQPPPINVTVEQVGKGIWWLAGGLDHSIVFEFDDHLTLFEVPSDARTAAVIATAKTLSPKPLTHAVVSHHHVDHAGGFRTAVAEGLTIITHRGNEAFLRDLAARPHTIRPDALARNPREPTFELMDDMLTLKDGTNEVQLFKTNGNVHSGLLIYAWVPRDRIVSQGDLYDDNWWQHPWGDNFIENLKTRGLAPLRHVPIHGRIQTHQEVLQTLATKPRVLPAT